MSDETEIIEIPRSLAERTLQVLLSAPVSQVYFLVREWDESVPDLIKQEPS